MSENKIHLTSAEIASLWTAYMEESMSKYILKFILIHIQDSDIKPDLQHSYDISCNQLEKSEHIFREENFSIPNGFTERDVNLEAPWLYSDIFSLSYINHMTKVGMLAYSGFVAMSTREDIRIIFTEALSKSAELYNLSSNTGLSKGIHSRHPFIEVPKSSDYVESKKYLSGLNPLSEKRPLNSVEISHLYQNIASNSIGLKLCLSFAQTSQVKEVQDYMIRARDISKKHITIFIDTLLQDDIEAPYVPDLAVSESTTQTFSDKLMMFHVSLIISAGIGNYATAAAASQRSDLAVNYERLSLEVAKLAKSGADIMIKHHWLEEPPGTKDREKLAYGKEKS